MEPSQSHTPGESAVEERANVNLQQNLPALTEAYRDKFGNEISTDNAREIGSPEYAASKEGRTQWGRATQNRPVRWQTISTNKAFATRILPGRESWYSRREERVLARPPH